MAGFLMLGVENAFPAVLSTLLTTATVILVVNTVMDIDGPFYGQWALTPEPNREIPRGLDRIEGALAEAD